MSGGQVYGEGFAIIPDSVLFSDVSCNAKVLYAILARHANDEGRCYPGRKLMAKLMCCSEDTVTRAKKELVEAKHIECHERYDEHGRRSSDDVFLRGARRTGAAGVRRTGAATELEPERRTTPTESVGSSSSVGSRKKAPPAPAPAFDQLPPEVQAELDRIAAPLSDEERAAGHAGIAKVREQLGWSKK